MRKASRQAAFSPLSNGTSERPSMFAGIGAPIPANIDGRSLVPLLKGENAAWRDAFLIEYFSDTVFPRMLKMGYQAVRTNQLKDIHYVDLDGMDGLSQLQ